MGAPLRTTATPGSHRSNRSPCPDAIYDKVKPSLIWYNIKGYWALSEARQFAVAVSYTGHSESQAVLVRAAQTSARAAEIQPVRTLMASLAVGRCSLILVSPASGVLFLCSKCNEHGFIDPSTARQDIEARVAVTRCYERQARTWSCQCRKPLGCQTLPRGARQRHPAVHV